MKMKIAHTRMLIIHIKLIILKNNVKMIIVIKIV